MGSQQRYALVAYVQNQVGEFVEKLRKELHPALPHLEAHVTLLPPRYLQGTEAAAVDTLERYCPLAEPFEVSLGEVETFIPVTPTVFVRVAHAAYRMRELHDLLPTLIRALNLIRNSKKHKLTAGASKAQGRS